MSNELAHFGIKGMKWGKRKASISEAINNAKNKETEFRQKLSNIQKNKNVDYSDLKRFEYRNKHVASRITGTALSMVAHRLVSEVLTGRIGRYKKMSKAQMAKEISSIAIRATASTAVQDALAKSASKRYEQSGKKVKGVKSRLITKEDAIETGVKVGMAAVNIGLFATKLKVAKAKVDRQRNEDRFKKWGANILPQKASDTVLWTDGNMSVFGKKGG